MINKNIRVFHKEAERGLFHTKYVVRFFSECKFNNDLVCLKQLPIY